MYIGLTGAAIFKLAILFFFVVVFVVYIYIYISPERHNTNRETPPLEVIPDKLLNFIVLKEYYTVRKSHKIERITYKTTNLFQKHSVAKLLYSKPVFPYTAPPSKIRLLLHEHFPLSKHISGLLSKCISDENYKFQSYFRKLYNIKDCSVKLKYSSLSGKVWHYACWCWSTKWIFVQALFCNVGNSQRFSGFLQFCKGRFRRIKCHSVCCRVNPELLQVQLVGTSKLVLSVGCRACDGADFSKASLATLYKILTQSLLSSFLCSKAAFP